MRTIEEIKAKIDKDREWDIFGLTGDLIVYLPYDDAKPYIKPEITEDNWKSHHKSILEADIIAEMKEYMPFALDKADNHRGISAGRSVEHYANWLFLIGDDELYEFAEKEENYAMYGCPVLKAVCEKYGMEYPTTKDMQNMARGEPCMPGCPGCSDDEDYED